MQFNCGRVFMPFCRYFAPSKYKCKEAYMTRKISSRVNHRLLQVILFGLTWIAGLICGRLIANQASDQYLLLMRGAAVSSVSIICLLAAECFPFLCVFFSVYISRPGLIYLVCFCKACSFSFTGFAIMAAFGSAGWLVRFLLQFTSSASLALLCWYALRHLDGNCEKIRADGVLCGLLVCCLGCIDYCYVSQFLAALM